MYYNIIILYVLYCLRPRSHWVGQKFSLVSLILVICRLVVIKSSIPGDSATLRLLTTFLHGGVWGRHVSRSRGLYPIVVRYEK
jgi:hypothetical protein